MMRRSLPAVTARVGSAGPLSKRFQQRIGQLLSAGWRHYNPVDNHSFRAVVVDVFLVRDQGKAEHSAFHFFDFANTSNKNILCAECFGQWWLLPHHSLPDYATKQLTLSVGSTIFAIQNQLKDAACSFSRLIGHNISFCRCFSNGDNFRNLLKDDVRWTFAVATAASIGTVVVVVMGAATLQVFFPNFP